MIENTTLERRRYAVRKAAERLKSRIEIGNYLQAHDVEVRHNRARCVVHNGDNPQSFSIDPERQLWYCHACQNGGDLIDLCELVEKHADTWTAIDSLSQRFNVSLPERPPRWHRRQREKAQIRDVAAEARKAVRRERMFRVLVLSGPEFQISDPRERRKAVAKAWKIFESGMKRMGQ